MKKIFVFDLDFTLWDTGGVWCDCTTPPFKQHNGQLRDAHDRILELYPDTLRVLSHLRENNYKLAVASRTSRPDWARELLRLFGIDHYFDFKEIYPTSKVRHLSQIKKDSGFNFTEMVFFDDEYRNIEDARSLGVKAEFVKNGISFAAINKHL